MKTIIAQIIYADARSPGVSTVSYTLAFSANQMDINGKLSCAPFGGKVTLVTITYTSVSIIQHRK